ncbi:MAG: methylated-DNA--[protein]-cysteine S-methyltransferase [Thermoanaerobaculia bacterium]
MLIIETPIGPLHAVADDAGRLVELGFREPLQHTSAPMPQRVVDQVHEYFAGKRQTFELELAPRGTPFQLAVWNALREIPYGDTISYAELARRIGKPAAVRAVGAANGANPIPVIIPCHRVIGSNGTLTGYGGGIERKQWLLAHEGRRLF